MQEKTTQSEVVLLIEQYLTENFEMRYNVLNNKIEVRERKEEETSFRPLTEKMTNSIIRRIKIELEEATNVKQNVMEYINSEDICMYNPIRDYLFALPEWDGQNRVTELLGRIPGITAEQIYWLSIWMRSAVAHWLGMDTLHGNECVPTLIGSQGCGKSTFWRRILPPALRQYFLDHINLGNKFDKDMALSNNLLVNLDELDQIKPSQQAEMKHTVSKVKVNGRPIYGRSQDDRDRYASFVATTNNLHPLSDPTGSRRYICIRIPDGLLIDNETDIDYEQFYAQLIYEVKEKEMRYWFTNEETNAIQTANAPFQHEVDLGTMLTTCFRLPEEGEKVTPMLTKQIIEELTTQFPTIKRNISFSVRVGKELNKLGFERKLLHRGVGYNVVKNAQ